MSLLKDIITINPFKVNDLYIHPLKMSENQRFSNILKGIYINTSDGIEMEYWCEMG